MSTANNSSSPKTTTMFTPSTTAVITVATLFAVASGQLFQEQPPPLQHPAVVENSIAESQLPAEQLNPFYRNPALADTLARESWFKDKEYATFHRDADDIPRSEVFKIFRRAGWAR